MPCSNPTDSADLDRGQNRNLQNPSVLATRATLKKRLDFGSATRNTNTAMGWKISNLLTELRIEN
jgi:hypothetical protein